MLNAAIAQHIGKRNGIAQMRTLEKDRDVAEKILMKAVPGNVERRFCVTRQDDVRRIELRLAE